MFKLAWRNIAQRKIRFALTTLPVVLGVAFVVAVFTLTDSLRATFGDLAEDVTAGTDLTVRAAQEFGSDFDRPTVPDSLVPAIESAEGVYRVYPGVAAFNVVIVDDAGEAIVPQGAPALGFNFDDSSFFLVEGREPTADGEFAADVATVGDNGLRIGGVYSINGPTEVRAFELVGTFNFGSPDEHNGLGQTMTAFELDTAQQFLGFDDEVLEVGVVVAPGASPATVKADLEALLDDDYEVITQQAAADEQQADFDEVLSIFSTVLSVFAFIALFVSAFIINNVFQITIGQRVRELGLWRSIGATPAQLVKSVLAESVLVGALATAAGTVGGIGLSRLLMVVLRAGGFELPQGPLDVRLRTIALAAAVGVGVSVAASLSPALRTRRVAPIAALQPEYLLASTGLRRRLIGGSATLGVGVVLVALALFGGFATAVTLVLAGGGALLAFVGINIVSPAFAAFAARVLGRPVAALMRVPGRLARDNAARNPRRTASTAGALMIGLALVALAAVVGASLTRSFVRTLESSVEADYFITGRSGGFNPNDGFSVQVVDDLAALDELDSVVGFRWAFGAVRVDGSTKDVLSGDMDTMDSHFGADLRAGSMAAGDSSTSMALHVDPARDLGVTAGDTLEMTFPDNETETLTVAAVYGDARIYGNWVIDSAVWDRHFNRSAFVFASATVAGLSDQPDEAARQQLLAASRTAIDTVLETYPTVQAENRAEFRESQQSQLDSLLVVITVFLGLSLIIAFAGIAITLALSVFERTREIGLLRAVGMTRRQLRRAVRWEAAIVATFGAVLGVCVGVVAGVAATVALPDSFVSDIDIPVASLAFYVVLSAALGLLAAVFPARRAGRMNILEAISHE